MAFFREINCCSRNFSWKCFWVETFQEKRLALYMAFPYYYRPRLCHIKAPTCPTTLIYFSICYTQWANKSQIMEKLCNAKINVLEFFSSGELHSQKKNLKNVSVGQKKCILFNSRTFFIISAHNLPIVISFTFLFTLKVSKTMNHAGCRRKKIRGEKY